MPLLWRVKASSSSSFSLSVLGDYKRSGGSRVFRHRVIMFGLRSHPSITKVRLRFWWWCAGKLCAGWVQIREYGGCGPFLLGSASCSGTMRSSATCSQVGHYL
ncbi:unnamed protein product [Brassica oleracea var. botrytis]